jgi:hypothetical protein
MRATEVNVLAVTGSAPSVNEQFVAVRSAGFGQVLRGVSFTSGTDQYRFP